MSSVPSPRDARGWTTRLPPALAANVWKPGQSGNPSGRGGEYQRCLQLCRANSFDAAHEIIRLSRESDNERVRFMAATWTVERAWGKTPPTFDPNAEKAPIAFDVRDYNTPQELTQIEATLQLIKSRQELIRSRQVRQINE